MWQIADMERSGTALNVHEASGSMDEYFKNGFTSFDMADHYGSSEIIAGEFKNSNALGCLLYTSPSPRD